MQCREHEYLSQRACPSLSPCFFPWQVEELLDGYSERPPSPLGAPSRLARGRGGFSWPFERVLGLKQV